MSDKFRAQKQPSKPKVDYFYNHKIYFHCYLCFSAICSSSHLKFTVEHWINFRGRFKTHPTRNIINRRRSLDSLSPEKTKLIKNSTIQLIHYELLEQLHSLEINVLMYLTVHKHFTITDLNFSDYTDSLTSV